MTGLIRGALCEYSSLNTISHIFRRMVSYRKNCKFMDKPKCNLGNIQKSPCYKDIIEGKVLPDHPLSYLWNKPECCNEPCKDAYTRFDDLYYFISDKSKRKYTRTWKECSKVVRCKRICCYDGKERSPPFKKRPKNFVIDTACPSKPDCLALTGRACPMVKSPGCQAQHGGNPQCKKRFVRAPCEKFCTPYPSFSECLREMPNPLRTNEDCVCSTIPVHCDLIGKQAPVRHRRCR